VCDQFRRFVYLEVRSQLEQPVGQPFRCVVPQGVDPAGAGIDRDDLTRVLAQPSRDPAGGSVDGEAKPEGR
jgi:hypothetical protein